MKGEETKLNETKRRGIEVKKTKKTRTAGKGKGTSLESLFFGTSNIS